MSTGYTVETNVPIPSRAARYPFASMKKGESFAIVEHAEDADGNPVLNDDGSEAVDVAKTADVARKVRNAAYQFSRKQNQAKEKATGTKGTLRFSLRKLADGTYRLWCVEA